MSDNTELIATGSQTVGPYFHLGMTGPFSVGQIAGPNVRGERLKLICTVYDGEGNPTPDAMIETWQANAEGKYNNNNPDDTQAKPLEVGFRGFGRLATNNSGVCEFETVKPGCIPSWTNAPQAPHLEVSVFARGVLKRLATRVYFSGDPANEGDPVLALVPEERRGTLMATLDSADSSVWRFDIYLSGNRETVFFDV